MEVHHHAHSARKKWTHYLWEFLMLFLAVFCGFLAENIREHQIEHRREKQYMRSMLEDLRNDTSNLMHEYHSAIDDAKGMDSLKTMLYSDPARLNIPELYRLQVSYSSLFGVTFDNRTSSQLKAGGMNYIKNREVANAISNYWLSQSVLLNTIDNISGKLDHAYELRYAIFNFKYADLNLRDSITRRFTSPLDPNSRLLSTDPSLLVNYANRLSYVVIILNHRYSVQILKQYKSATELIALIQKEYHLK